MKQVTATGASAKATSDQANQVLAETRPLVLSTLKELQQLSMISRKLLQLLLGMTDLEEEPTNR